MSNAVVEFLIALIFMVVALTTAPTNGSLTTLAVLIVAALFGALAVFSATENL